jgi:hypothetical protein
VLIEVFSPVREDLHPDTEYAPFIQSWNRWRHHNRWWMNTVTALFLLNIIFRFIQTSAESYIVEKSIIPSFNRIHFNLCKIKKQSTGWSAIVTYRKHAFLDWDLKSLDLW